MFDNALADIESKFASSDWTTHNIKTIPDNYQGTIGDVSEYCMVKVMPSNATPVAFGVEKRLSGLLAVKIYVPAGYGQGRVMQIADLLDGVLQYQIINQRTTLESSYLNVEGLDPSNSALYSASYFIPFTLYGE